MNHMTHPEMILYAVNELRKQGKSSFTREDIRAILGVDTTHWAASFNPVVQGMRVDQPGGALTARGNYRNVFRRISRGVYVLTEQGTALVEEMFGHPITKSAQPSWPMHNTATPMPSIKQTAPIRRPQKDRAYSEKIQQILQKAETYHQAYYRSEVFGTPCLYFHLQALKTRQDPTSTKHLEYVYATLISWGMHRLGKGGSKMRDFGTFFESIKPLKDNILKAQIFDCNEMDEDKWAIIETIFKGIQVMDSQTSLVGNSKAMHHMLPNIIPPIDRTYTLSFLHGNTIIRNDIDGEWQLMKKIISDFFIPVATDDRFKLLANDWVNRSSEYPWDTSTLKIIDNIVVGAMKK